MPLFKDKFVKIDDIDIPRDTLYINPDMVSGIRECYDHTGKRYKTLVYAPGMDRRGIRVKETKDELCKILDIQLVDELKEAEPVKKKAEALAKVAKKTAKAAKKKK